MLSERPGPAGLPGLQWNHASDHGVIRDRDTVTIFPSPSLMEGPGCAGVLRVRATSRGSSLRLPSHPALPGGKLCARGIGLGRALSLGLAGSNYVTLAAAGGPALIMQIMIIKSYR